MGKVTTTRQRCYKVSASSGDIKVEDVLDNHVLVRVDYSNLYIKESNVVRLIGVLQDYVIHRHDADKAEAHHA